MQAVALEMNLSETAFLVPEEDGFHLRWFTPDRRGRPLRPRDARLGPRPLGGRPPPARRPARSSGPGAAGSRRPKADGWITLDFPAKPVERPVDPGPVAEALGVPVVVGRG